MNRQQLYKVFTSDLGSPIQGGPPVWDGTLPFTLPTVALDTSGDECGAGWNFCSTVHDALRIGGLWPRTGRPSRVFECEAGSDLIQRGNKLRSSECRVVRELSTTEVNDGILRLSQVFGEHQNAMAASQIEWRTALQRPKRDAAIVDVCLSVALRVRGLDWRTKQFDSAGAAWNARAAWDAGDAWAARAAGDAGDAWAARAARDARDARAAWDARDARAAWAALTVQFAALSGWTQHDPMLLTTGIRDAYRFGLALAIPTAPGELGWAMVDA